MTTPCDTHVGETPRSLFCKRCGTVIDRDGLKKVRVMDPFGRNTNNPKVEEFFQTGDPSVFDRP